MQAAGVDLHRAPIVVAVSGGADSVALLALLVRMGCDCRAAHCNFHLRGEESMRDMRFVRDLCARLGVDLYVRDFDVAAYMAVGGASVETACRELRYRWFDELLDREHAAYIAVGHHCEDRAETFVLNLMRGAGIDGLTSMRAVNGTVIRPLLRASRGDIESFLDCLGLEYVTDSTNAGCDFRRNSVRNRVFPLLTEIFGPSALDSVLRSVENLERSRGFYTRAVDAGMAEYTLADGTIDIMSLVEKEADAPLLLFETLRRLNFNFSQTSEMVAAAGASGAAFYSVDGKVAAEVSYGRLMLADASHVALSDKVYDVDLTRDITEPITIRLETCPVERFITPTATDAKDAYFDADTATARHKWRLRHYRRGDRMVPFGSVKSKLLSDLFANARYTPRQRREAWLLECDGTIVWIPGLKNSSFAPVGPGTRRYVHLRYEP